MRTLPEKTHLIEIGDQRFEFDQADYLVDSDAWDRNVAEYIAARQNIELTQDRWDVVNYVREFYNENGIAPDARFVFGFLAERNQITKSAGRKMLFELFPYGYVQQVCKISGMRQPRAWSTG